MATWTRTTADDRTAVTTTAVNFQVSAVDILIELQPTEYAVVTVLATFPGTASDAIFEVYSSGDGTNFDTIPYTSFLVELSASATRRRTFTLSGIRYFKIGVKSAGANNLSTAGCIINKAVA